MEPKTLIFVIIIIAISTPLPSLSFQFPSNKTPIASTLTADVIAFVNSLCYMYYSIFFALTMNIFLVVTIQQQFLRPHNILRAKLRLPPLKWSNSLALYASRWAQTRGGDCKLIHSGGPYGENLFWGSGKGWSPRDAVAAWASEMKYYDRRTYHCKANGDCLHYTQLVWKKSSRIGCAISFCKTGATFIICNYDPPGNIVGQPPF